MARALDQLTPHAALVEIGRDFHARGWMAGTAGNLSIRVHDNGVDSFWITASGLPKGRMEETDLLRIGVDEGRIVEQLQPRARPSAESSIHQAIYRLFPEARACLHVHTVDACLACENICPGVEEMPLPPLEMIKGLGVWEQHPEVALPLFDNILDVTQIAAAIERRFRATPPRLPALMIRNHGVTVWGGSAQEAYDRVEIVEFIMSYMARRR
ncbi:MAG: methylthioribulose 1-phosphate dehydratase [Gammaproteobacteria bacterium]|nr:methylthioribulose 1-phosphate dehydratase [Gammaproteobacteria bacterium]